MPVSSGSQQPSQAVRVVGFKGDELIAEGGEKREEQSISSAKSPSKKEV